MSVVFIEKRGSALGIVSSSASTTGAYLALLVGWVVDWPVLTRRVGIVADMVAMGLTPVLIEPVRRPAEIG